MMRAFSLALLSAILLLSPITGLAQKKTLPPASTAATATPDDYALLNRQKEVQGKLVTFETSTGSEAKAKKNLLFRYDYEVTDVNPNYKPTKVAPPHDFTKEINALQMKIIAANQMQNLQKRQTTLQQLAVQQQQLMMRINQDQINWAQRVENARQNDIRTGNVPYIKVARAKEFLLEIQDDVVVRRLKMPVEYNDKGFLKEYSKSELDKLHLVDNKDGTKPGYPSKYEELQPKQVVSLHLTPGKMAAKVDKSAKTDKADADPVIPLRPMVRMIVIVEDIANPNGLDSTLPPLKKKKKKD